uniref:Fem-1 homolog A n=1 Tax=Macaca fascicularis TaxID=9541 RepID=A0A7N9CMH2_MACFA
MDLRTAVYNAARDGKLQLLQKLLSGRSREETGRADGRGGRRGTPLLIAARYGHLDVVEYLVDRCGASVEAGGSVHFDGETIEGAPPLWAASAAGHLDVVRSLLRRGASVNRTTRTNSTPLRAACFDGHLEVVRYLVGEHQADLEVANRHGHTCLMISCYKGHREIARYLLEQGAQVNRRSAKGNTALHDCAESGSLEILQLLLGCKARMERDGYGMTPLLAASVTGHTNIVEYLIQEQPGQEQIAGGEAQPGLPQEGPSTSQGCAQPQGAPCCSSSPEEPLNGESYESCCPTSREAAVEALELLGATGAVYADSGNFERCIRLWKYALDMQQTNLEPLSPMTASSFLSFAELFSYVLQDRAAKGSLGTQIGFADLMGVLTKGVREVERALQLPREPGDSAQFTKALAIILHLLYLLEKVECTPSQEHLKHQTVYRLLKCAPRGKNGFTPLHMAVDKDTTNVGRYPVGRFPSLHVVKVLLDCGADPDSRDFDNNTPLHIAAQNNCPAIMNALIEAGAHMDATNAFKKTAYELLDEKLLARGTMQPFNYVTLQCLAARALDKNKIPYKGFIPEDLEAFIELH